MRKSIIISICLLLFILPEIYTQNKTITASYSNIPLTELLEIIKQESKCNFYYKEEWIKDIKVKISGDSLDVFQTLSDILKNTGLNLYADSYGNYIIYEGSPVTSSLPSYKQYQSGGMESEIIKTQATSTESKYQEGKITSQIEEIEVGNSNQSVKGKTYVVSGRITESESGSPILGATVFIKELGLGAATDLDGYFNLPLKPGKYIVSANSLSMAEKKFYLQVYSNGFVSIPLEKELVNIKEVEVVADRNNNVKGIQMGYSQISTKNVKEIPIVMGEKDLLKIAQLLPGVQSAGEGASGLNVRGGTADQNLFYINKLPVYNTSHLFGFFTAFNSDIINDFTLYKSNVPAKYGGRVSSVFDISTRQGNKKEFFMQGGISPVTGHIAIEGPVIKDHTSFVLSYRGTYSDWLLTQLDDKNLQNSNAAFYDWSATVNSEIDKNNLVKFFLYNSKDKFSLSTTDDYDYANAGGSLSWKHIFSPQLNGDFAIVYSNYNFGHNSKSNPSEAYRQDYELNHTEMKADFVYLNAQNHRITFGGTSTFYNLNRGTISPFGTESTRLPLNLGIEKGIESALYISDEYAVTPRLTVLGGIRYSFYTMLGPGDYYEYFPGAPMDENNIKDTLSFSKSQIVKFYSAPEPRIALNYALGYNNSVKASYNRIQQYIFMLSNTIAISPTDQWKLADYHIKPPLTDQVSLGYYHDFPEKGIVTSVEVYKKWTKNVVEYKDGVDFISDERTEMLLLQGKQESAGVELLVKKNAGKFTGWLSYCYSRSIVQVKSDIITEQINFGNPFPSNYDRPHSFNFVSTLRGNRRLSLSTNLIYSTGRPITYPVAIYYAEGQEMIHFSERNKYRVPDYFRIDLSVNLEGNLVRQKWIHSYWMFNVYNITGRKNAYSVYYEANNGQLQGYKLSVFGQPIVTLSWNFKFGNYASE